MSPAADSAGQPFAGRSFTPHPFQGDNGAEDLELARARETFFNVLSLPASGRTSAQLEAAWMGVVEALRGARLLSPLMAEAGDFGATESGAVVEKTQELSVVHLEGPDGRAVAPVFSSVERMSKWNREARPVPVETARAALATVADGLDVMVLDPGSPHQVALRRSALKALATGSEYQPPWLDSEVLAAVARGLVVAGSLVSKHRVVSGDPSQTLSGPEVVVVVGVGVGEDPEELRKRWEDVSLVWSEDPVLTTGVDGLGIRVIPD
jgi:hypothetical protein